jgi:hypothetical protein
MLLLRKWILFLAAPLLFMAVAGCGGGPKIVKVEGTLTYKGSPVPNVTVNFQPENGRSSWGETDDQGHFVLHYDEKHDGAVAGKHTVSVFRSTKQTVPSTMSEAAGKSMKTRVTKDVQEMLNKYATAVSTEKITLESSTSDLKLDLK